MAKYLTAFLAILILVILACKKPLDYRTRTHETVWYGESVKKLTEVIVHDIFGPTVASRIYLYPAVAASEVLNNESKGISLCGRLKGLTSIPKPDKNKKYDFAIASVLAYNGVAEKLVFTGQVIHKFRDSLLDKYRSLGVPEEVIRNSDQYAREVQSAILAWAARDNYGRTRSFPKYNLSNEPGRWQPTPPAYLDGNEPNWKYIRPLVMDSAAQFRPAAAPVYSEDKKSVFYKLALEVYQIKRTLSREQTEVANFWDCNPFALNLNGHAMFARKKISPGAHWELIALLAANKSHSRLNKLVFTQALVSVVIFEAFISCWDEKYRSQLIRPETYINKFIDPEWRPVLQTPPFPEYISGHSIISSGAAKVLGHQYGESFAFADSSELAYGLPVRKFESFQAASDEAAISRLYGGIHYMPAITEGQICGDKIGKYIIDKLAL